LNITNFFHPLFSKVLKYFQFFLFDAQCWILRAIHYFQISLCNATFFLIFFSQFFIGFEFAILELL